MSKLQMQASKERAQKARKQQRERFRPVDMDETFDLSKSAPNFVTVPRGIDGARLNRKTLEFELLRGDDVVETLSATGLELQRRLDVIEASIPANRRNAFRRQLKAANDELGKVIADHDWCQIIKPEVRGLQQWQSGGVKLRQPGKSCTADILAALENNRVAATDAVLSDIKKRMAETPPTPFVIEHDWAAAFQNAEDFDEGDVPLPFDEVMFEFAMAGGGVTRRVCVWASETRESVLFVSVTGGWVAAMGDCLWPERTRGDLVSGCCDSQIRAVAIALDAEIAVKDVVRADEKLNRRRADRGKPPLLDYHVVRLARRERAAPLERADDERRHRSPRLHFVRGHWRHYGDHKTWIRWHLRGDPDLGFIDKHYRL